MDDRTVIDIAHRSGEKGRPSLRSLAPGECILGIGETADEIYMLMSGEAMVAWAPGTPDPKVGPLQASPTGKNFPIIGAKSFFTRQPSRCAYFARGPVTVAVINSAFLVEMYKDNCVNEAAEAFVRALLQNSELSDQLQSAIAKVLKIAPNELAAIPANQRHRYFSAFREFRIIATRSVYRLLMMRNQATDDPSLVIGPPAQVR